MPVNCSRRPGVLDFSNAITYREIFVALGNPDVAEILRQLLERYVACSCPGGLSLLHIGFKRKWLTQY